MTNRIKLKGNHDSGIDLTAGTLTNTLEMTDGVGCTLGATMTADPAVDAEDGFLTILVDGVARQIPFYDA